MSYSENFFFPYIYIIYLYIIRSLIHIYKIININIIGVTYTGHYTTWFLYMSIIASCYKVLVDMAVNVLKIKMFEKITHGPSL